MVAPELPPHHPTPEQQRAYRAALHSLKQVQDEFHAVHGEPLSANSHDVPPEPHESTLMERERAVHEAERITLQMTRHWRQLRARERPIGSAALDVGRPVSPPAAASADAPSSPEMCHAQPTVLAPAPQERAALPDVAAVHDNPYLAPAARRAAVTRDVEVLSTEQWHAVLEDTEARLGAEIDALAAQNRQLERQVQHLTRALRLANVETWGDAVEIVARAFADAAGPAVEAWRETLAETEERLSLDIDVLRDTNIELLQQLEMAEEQQLLHTERDGGASPTVAAVESACSTAVKTLIREPDVLALKPAELEPGAKSEPESRSEAIEPQEPGSGHRTPPTGEARSTDVSSSVQPAAPENATRSAGGVAVAVRHLPFVDIEVEQLRAQKQQLEDDLDAATTAMNDLQAREAAITLREAGIAERERVVEHSAAQAMRELASVRERERRLSELEGGTRK